MLPYGGLSTILCGIALSALGTLNHFIHESRAPIYIDVTMGRGDGGFIVDGLFLAAIGIILLFRAR